MRSIGRAAPLIFLCGLWSLPSVAGAQDARPHTGDGAISRFAVQTSPIELIGPARDGVYLGVTGPRSAWLGVESGAAEIWVHPLKVARNFQLEFQVPEYGDPIPGRRVARTVTVRPELTTITYAHQSFTVHQHILAPIDEGGVLLRLDVRTVRPLEIIVSFEPVLQLMWPGAFGGQYLFWDEAKRAFILSESLRERNAVIGSPRATDATAHLAHRLAEAPAAFRIAVDSDRAAGEPIPVAIAAGTGTREAVLATYDRLIANAGDLYAEKRAWADSVLATTTILDSPEDDLDLALEWAKINLEEQRVCNPDLGCGFVAGWGISGSSFRPGFGWFFGGDAAMNTLAMDVTGQWDLVAEDLRFLARYQRDDGKIPHEISQSAAHLDWFGEYPYPYYHADTTPWWMTAVWQYWKASGDGEFLTDIWPAYRKAWEWCLSVETDGDGLIENTTGGLAAVEVGEIGAGVHQDVYLASVWTAAVTGAAEIAAAIGDREMAAGAAEIRDRALRTLNEAYWSADRGHLAFALLRDGDTNESLTVWPAAGLMFGLFDETPAAGTLRSLSTDAVASDWGARMLSSDSELYDPLQYNSGTVWPFVTGYLSLGQYRYRRSWSAYPLLAAVGRTTFDWSLGRNPELLSGAFYVPLDETVPHQFFASSMIPTPLIRGLLGWDPDAPNGSARLAPQLPADWDRASVRNLPIGETRIDVSIERGPGRLDVRIESAGPPVDLTYVALLPAGAGNPRITLDGADLSEAVSVIDGASDLEVPVRLEGDRHTLVVAWTGGLEVVPPRPRLEPGQASTGLRILDFSFDGRRWTLEVEGEAGRSYTVQLVGEPVTASEIGAGEATSVRSEGSQTELELTFPPGPASRSTIEVALEAVR